MAANSWPEKDADQENSDPLNTLLSGLSDDQLETETVPNLLNPSRFQMRRIKAALVLTIIWSSTIALHLISWGWMLMVGLTAMLSIHAFRIIFTKPEPSPLVMEGDLPFVSVLVAAKNEETVINRLVENLCSLEYAGNYEVWIIDDNSTDQTPKILQSLQLKYPQLNVFNRNAQASGGKSGALNQVLSLTKGDIIAVFDADAQLSPDLLTKVVPLFQREKVGAVQLRKAIANADKNFWTKGQRAEMALDMWFQQQRTTIGGIGELRGNGQFVRREALDRCGGWNEETITDDLDLTVRLHLDQWDIKCVFYPPVQEEGVTNALALWHQRSRWAEGGYQRYLDYGDLILRNTMGASKTLDLLIFVLIMYILPTASIPDLLMSIILHRPPILAPITGLSLTMSVVGMFAGLQRTRLELAGKSSNSGYESNYVTLLLQTIQGTIYMLHWLVVMGITTARMSIRPKRLKWVKTVHRG